MADPFVAEIRIFPFNFAPTGWALCNGQLLPISQNTALFSLVGTFYGGDGRSTFALPNLMDRFPMHQGLGAGLSERFPGEQGGTNTVTLLQSEMPAHSHTINTHDAASTTPIQAPQGASLGVSPAKPYSAAAPDTKLAPDAVSFAGGSQPHNNMPPFLALNFCIAMQGIFPPRS